jgi:hypothetical protein
MEIMVVEAEADMVISTADHVEEVENVTIEQEVPEMMRIERVEENGEVIMSLVVVVVGEADIVIKRKVEETGIEVVTEQEQVSYIDSLRHSFVLLDSQFNFLGFQIISRQYAAASL